MPDQPQLVEPQVALDVLAIVSSGDLTMEAAMRHLYPEVATQIYNPGRWPWGPPTE